jgi:RNA polymerase sigma-70 factor, ECF subfamily
MEKRQMYMQTDSLTSENMMIPAIVSLSEARLLQDARRGRREAFDALCLTLTPRLLKTAFRITRNREDAEDAVQDSLMRALMHINSFQGNSSFSTWLTRIVMNSALMIRRKNRNARRFCSDDLGARENPGLELQIPDRSPNPEQAYAERERKAILHEAIGKLRPRIRAVVEVAHQHELPLRETARVLDISVAAVKGRFFHARVALRKSAALIAIARAKSKPAA